MKKIKLTKGQYALVDDEDFERIAKIRWFASIAYGGTFRATGHGGYGRKGAFTIYMHRIIMNCPDGYVVDHINHNQLDNRKCNLRICEHRQNVRNVRKIKKTSSKYKGVCYDKVNNKWSSQITFNYKSIKIGRLDNEKDAASAYDKKAKELFGKFAYLNFRRKK